MVILSRRMLCEKLVKVKVHKSLDCSCYHQQAPQIHSADWSHHCAPYSTAPLLRPSPGIPGNPGRRREITGESHRM
ncbi:hypothetical protein RRG08_000926 [Elysia crispata]|uniref:Uncharacterized protein n=1 Tax=Elysia crispata TaxID=231223 RepID=A0AAE1D9N5_9GAST|nr:hypothetical protein RRG08_000926 [Elysia crispata]